MAATAFLSACGGWKEDPLDGKNQLLREGTEKPIEIIDEKPVKSDAVRINAPDDVSVEETQALEFEITGRVLLDGYTVDVEIQNLADFPGATYDRAKHLFKWTAPVGFVERSGTAEGYRVKVDLMVRALARASSGAILERAGIVKIEVSRSFTVPVINAITKARDILREGEMMNVVVDYTDKDASAGDRNTWARIALSPAPGVKNLSGLLTLYSVENRGGTNYRATYAVDAREADLTDSIDPYGANFTVITRYGKASMDRSVNMNVYMSFASPVTTWIDTLQLVEEQPMVHKFVVSDPRLEALMSMTPQGPMGSATVCMPTSRGVLNCTFTWTPPLGATGPLIIYGGVSSRNRDSRDTFVSNKNLMFNLYVQPKGP